MIDSIYRIFEALGYPHPLHPPATHIPMGMLLGGFFFSLLRLKRGEFSATAYHCLVLSLIFLPVTAATGFMDWQHRLYGRMNGLILAKIIMTACLLSLLAAAAYKKQKGTLSERAMTAVWISALLLAMGLGYVGGELAYG